MQNGRDNSRRNRKKPQREGGEETANGERKRFYMNNRGSEAYFCGCCFLTLEFRVLSSVPISSGRKSPCPTTEQMLYICMMAWGLGAIGLAKAALSKNANSMMKATKELATLAPSPETGFLDCPPQMWYSGCDKSRPRWALCRPGGSLYRQRRDSGEDAPVLLSGHTWVVRSNCPFPLWSHSLLGSKSGRLYSDNRLCGPFGPVCGFGGF